MKCREKRTKLLQTLSQNDFGRGAGGAFGGLVSLYASGV